MQIFGYPNEMLGYSIPTFLLLTLSDPIRIWPSLMSSTQTQVLSFYEMMAIFIFCTWQNFAFTKLIFYVLLKLPQEKFNISSMPFFQQWNESKIYTAHWGFLWRSDKIFARFFFIKISSTLQYASYGKKPIFLFLLQ